MPAVHDQEGRHRAHSPVVLVHAPAGRPRRLRLVEIPVAGLVDDHSVRRDPGEVHPVRHAVGQQHGRPPGLIEAADRCADLFTGGQGGTVRADDNADALKIRLMAYYRETSPLIGYYQKEAEAGNTQYAKVDGTKAVADVRVELEKILG